MRTAKRQRIWDKTQGQCFYCMCDLKPDGEACANGDQSMVIEHKLPRTRGGGDTAENLVPACTPCNGSKGNKTVDEFRIHLLVNGYLPIFFCDPPEGHPMVLRDWLFVSSRPPAARGLRFERLAA